VSNRAPGVEVDWSRFEGKDAEAVVHEILHRDLSAKARAALDEGLQGLQATPQKVAGLILSSPEFQRR
jgi:hypothetical protein